MRMMVFLSYVVVFSSTQQILHCMYLSKILFFGNSSSLLSTHSNIVWEKMSHLKFYTENSLKCPKKHNIDSSNVDFWRENSK